MTTVSAHHQGNSPSKGGRLNWTPLKEVRPVPLTKQNTKGRQLSSKDLSKGRQHSKLLVP